MDRFSNCCGADMSRGNAKDTLICPDCKEPCSLDTYCTSCCNEELTEKEFVEKNGMCDQCAWLIKNM